MSKIVKKLSTWYAYNNSFKELHPIDEKQNLFYTKDKTKEKCKFFKILNFLKILGVN